MTEREPRELFWVVKNGIKMTGMPSFGAIGVPDQEIWSMVAFLKKLPTVLARGFQGLERALNRRNRPTRTASSLRAIILEDVDLGDGDVGAALGRGAA